MYWKANGFGSVISDPVSDYIVREVYRVWKRAAELADYNMLGI